MHASMKKAEVHGIMRQRVSDVRMITNNKVQGDNCPVRLADAIGPYGHQYNNSPLILYGASAAGVPAACTHPPERLANAQFVTSPEPTLRTEDAGYPHQPTVRQSSLSKMPPRRDCTV